MLLAALNRYRWNLIQIIRYSKKILTIKMEKKEIKEETSAIPPAPAPVAPQVVPAQPKEELKARILPPIPEIKTPQTSFSGRLRIRYLFEHPEEFVNKIAYACGWARTIRAQKKIIFVTLSDGSGPQNLQIVVDRDVPNFGELEKMKVGCCLGFKGLIVQSPGAKQTIEMQVKNDPNHIAKIFGECPAEEYPLSKKEHTVEVKKILNIST